MAKVLVTGATGTIGSQVVKELVAAGASVRVGLRDPGKGGALQAQGVEVVALDLERPETLKAAFAGVERLFLLTPFVEHFLPQVKAAVDAAKAAGVTFILRMSAFGADPQSPDGLAREHGQGERLVKESGLGWAVIQPSFFQDNVLTYGGAALAQQGAIYGASKDGKVSYVSSSDVGAVAAAILSRPEAHQGKTYVLTGPEAVTGDELAALLSKVVGQPIRYVDLAPADYLGAMTSQGVPRWTAEHIVALELVKANGWAAAISPVVREVLGREPERYAAFLERSRARFA
jgi:uncharacterized protein YbjT (DUF2867 family)